MLDFFLALLPWAALIVVAVFVWGAVTRGLPAQRAAKEHRANPGPIMDRLFDGSPQVTYTPGMGSHLSLDTLTRGASERGYRFGQSVRAAGQPEMWIFEKVSPEPRP